MSVTGKLLGGLAGVMLATPTLADCRQALALGLDVSGSVDADEYRLQLDGIAGALLSPEVTDALLADPAAPIRLMIYQWSGPQSTLTLVDWITITDEDVIADVAYRISEFVAPPGELTTAIGTALTYGSNALRQQDCWRHTLDLSGDGESNAGPRPQDIAEDDSITVNGLVVTEAANAISLPLYWKAYVIRGPEAFVEVANGYDDYEAAMKRKLLRELRSLAMGALQP